MSISKFTNYRSKEKEASERVYIGCHDIAVVSSGDQNINRGPSRQQQRRPLGTHTWPPARRPRPLIRTESGFSLWTTEFDRRSSEHSIISAFLFSRVPHFHTMARFSLPQPSHPPRLHSQENGWNWPGRQGNDHGDVYVDSILYE